MADKKEYFVKTFTSSKKNAGTDANVFITLTGEKGTTAEVQLKAEGNQNPFERGKMDIFRIRVDKDPGTLKKIRIRHDNKGVFPGWRLDKVSVIEEGTGATSVFPCFQCLSKFCGGNDLELPVSQDTTARQLRINKVDFLPEQNAPLHHTDEYDSPLVVVRRGAPFLVKLDFDHGFDRLKDNIVLEFRTGKTDKPYANKGTEVSVRVGDGPGAHGWEAELSSVKEGEPWAVVSVTAPARCPVAKWRMSVETISEGLSFETAEESELVILFNPWCEDDEVYLEGDDKRGEYVLREFGKVYQSWKLDRNSWKKVFSGKPWNYGQFEPEILDACLDLLDRSGVSVASRGSPVAVSRVVSQMVNSQDDNGVLVGNWSGDYSGGVAPWIWNGSVRILQQYHRTKEPVSYGQCWVFSAVTTTVLRCLGIPGRSVTNFSSAHDTDGSLTIDKIVDEDGNLLEDSDSVWNFHVWNEAWMARTDLPQGYGGWQALDATPQEKSSGIYCCGPASVTAIKHGEVQYNFDARFIFAEVNADKVHWCQQRDGSCYVAGMEKGTVGRFISTKAIGINDREDVTANYKYPEGSDEERVAVQRAAQYGSRRDLNPYESGTRDVEFSLKDDGSVPINEDADCSITLKNTSGETRTVTLLYVANIVKYTGVQHRKLRKEKIEVELKPKSTENVNVAVNPMLHMEHMEDKCALKFVFMAHVQETGQTFATERVVDIEFPDLDVKVLGKTNLGQQVSVAISLTNPLNRVLTNCEFNIEGPGLQKPKTVFFRNIRPSETVSLEEKFTPKRAGLKEIVANFSSNELCDITGEAEVQVDVVLRG